jgi:hypothetical protein
MFDRLRMLEQLGLVQPPEGAVGNGVPANRLSLKQES